jgi:hypothetical protein
MLPEGAGSAGTSVASDTSTAGASEGELAWAVTPGVDVSAVLQALKVSAAVRKMMIRKISLGIYIVGCLMGGFL